MAEIPNARRVYYKVTGCILESHHKPDIEKAMIEFAKLHVEAALKEASEKADTIYVEEDGCATGDYYEVDKDSILNSYPLTNIK
jgi:hypothetical protein